MGSPHAVVIPYPAQGHVIPMMELAHCLVERGIKITFVNTEFNHDRIMAASSDMGGQAGRLRMVSVPDGLGPSEDRNDLLILGESCRRIIPAFLEELIRASREEPGGDEFTWMISDTGMDWALAVAKKMGLRRASLFTLAAAEMVLLRSLPKLVQDGIVDDDGAPKKHEVIRLGPGMPPMDTTEFLWNHLGDSISSHKHEVFRYMIENATTTELSKLSEFILCNSFRDIESPSLSLVPDLLPVGPLLTVTGRRFGRPAGSFWPEDASCMSWLDGQPAGSVIYVAFGSFTVFNLRQFHELALGLQLTGRPFLWVVRPGLTNGAYPDGFEDRVANRARIVGWAPQHKVLAHPAVACFLSHCGWNSTMEGMMNGVQFLCWPYFADQFLNQSYICNVWRIGLQMAPDESEIVESEKIRSKVEELFADKEMKTRALEWKEKADKSVGEGGSSSENLNSFIEIMKE